MRKAHFTVHQLSYRNETVPGRNWIIFSKITGPRWLELPIARTDFDSPFEFEPVKFYCINVISWTSQPQQNNNESDIMRFKNIIAMTLLPQLSANLNYSIIYKINWIEDIFI